MHAELVRDALYGRLGDLGDSVHGMAVLFALDRRAAAAELREALRGHDVVLVDRYVASNAAYGAARLHQDAAGEFVAWVRALEIDRFAVPVPDHQLLLAVPPRWPRSGPRTGSAPRPAAAGTRSSPTRRCSSAPGSSTPARGGRLAVGLDRARRGRARRGRRHRSPRAGGPAAGPLVRAAEMSR